MYGETKGRGRRRSLGEGLSPHVRGNLRQDRAEVPSQGSIPACTGKPSRWPRTSWSSTVYPRMYGETMIERKRTAMAQGLSPHVRGNLGLAIG